MTQSYSITVTLTISNDSKMSTAGDDTGQPPEKKRPSGLPPVPVSTTPMSIDLNYQNLQNMTPDSIAETRWQLHILSVYKHFFELQFANAAGDT